MSGAEPDCLTRCLSGPRLTLKLSVVFYIHAALTLGCICAVVLCGSFVLGFIEVGIPCAVNLALLVMGATLMIRIIGQDAFWVHAFPAYGPPPPLSSPPLLCRCAALRCCWLHVCRCA